MSKPVVTNPKVTNPKVSKQKVSKQKVTKPPVTKPAAAPQAQETSQTLAALQLKLKSRTNQNGILKRKIEELTDLNFRLQREVLDVIGKAPFFILMSI